MKDKYDKIFITNLPSFYKIRLFNEINKQIQIFVIFTDATEKTRNNDFYNENISFEYTILNGNSLHKISLIKKIFKKTKYTELIIDGWDAIPNIFSALVSPKKLNGCIVESSIFESKIKGLKSVIKKMFLSRMSKAYPSGQTQKQLLQALSFKGEIIIQGGVGLINLQSQPIYQSRNSVKKFLFVGRLVQEKNLDLLIEVFNDCPELELNIIGFGELESQLRAIAKSNVHFLGAVNNKDLSKIYQENDVFILPSKSETWGLVVEEALNNGCPVIVSDRVGCKDDLITSDTGLIFTYNDKKSLRETIMKMTDINLYNKLRMGVSKMDFLSREQMQVNGFLGGKSSV